MKKENRLSKGMTWHLLSVVLILCTSVLVLTGCARMAKPDGGWYDEQPPRVIGSSPTDGGVNVGSQKVRIDFDEFIKLENASENVIISPPQLEQPEIKSQGKRIIVELKDSLKPNTTYTIDFGNAITDNNEGNSLGLYTYKFSTGERIDTLEVAGRVLNAEDLEPVKGIYVGLYPVNEDLKDEAGNVLLDDSVFLKEPLLRVARTDGSGKYRVCGVAPGSYRIFALQDADGNYHYSQKSEAIAFSDEIIVPSSKPDIRQDTLWRDTLHIQAISRVPFTHFMPDDVILRAFTAKQTDRFLVKTERKEAEHFDMFFSYGNDSLPKVRGLNFDSADAFVVEPSLKKDTVTYWLKDTALVNTDTLHVEVQYMMSDTLGVLFMNTDTLEILAKTPYEKRLKAKMKEIEQWQKEQDKKKKKDQPYEEVMKPVALKPKYEQPGTFTPLSEVTITVPTPIASIDTAAIHLTMKQDTLVVPTEFRIEEDSVLARKLHIFADWEIGGEYQLVVDSAAIKDIYGLVSDEEKKQIKVATEDDLSTLSVSVSLKDNKYPVYVQLLNSDKPERQSDVEQDGRAYFYYLKPGKYYMRAVVDMNGNGMWDTGDYYTHTPPEAVYYYNKEIEIKAKWDVKLEWVLDQVRLDQQKPAAIVKQKADKEKKKKMGKNADRAAKQGIPLPDYLKIPATR